MGGNVAVAGEGYPGDGTFLRRAIPVQVHGLNDVGYLTGVSAVACGRTDSVSSLALKSDSTVWSWGLIVMGS